MSSRTVLLEKLAAGLGPKGFTREPSAMSPWLEDWRKRYRGAAAALVSPATTEEVVQIVRLCAAEGVPLVPQGGNTSMVAGAIPDRMGESLLLSLRRMNRIRSVSAVAHSAVCEAGVILSDLHAAAAERGGAFPCRSAPRARRRRRPDQHQCRRHPGAALRHHARPRPGAGGGAAGRTLYRACPRSRRTIAAMI
jgi:FAD/FMN-containing dehydrogenase